MKALLIFFLFACFTPAAELHIIMDKGSGFKGSSDIKTLHILTDYGLLKVPIEKVVRSMRDKERFKVEMKDGAVVFGHLQMTHLKIKSAIGEFSPELKRIKEIRVVSNAGLIGNRSWVPPVKGVTMRLITHQNDFKNQQVHIKVEVKNISSEAISLRSPDINTNALYADGDSLFSLEVRNKDGIVYQLQEELERMMTANVSLSAGKSFTVDILLKIGVKSELVESKAMPDKIDGLNFRLITYAGNLPKGEHQIHLELSRYYHNGAWIHASDHETDSWNGVIKLKPIKLLLK